jgi:peptidylprolyl isomerase
VSARVGAVVAGAVIVAFAIGTVVAVSAGSAARFPVAADVGPYVYNQFDPANPHNADSHWHAALGVWDCDHWLDDGSAPGAWLWPIATPSEVPARASNPTEYAGMHSHDDGVIHMEPAATDEAGMNATVGQYFREGGWGLNATGFHFLGIARANGGLCAGRPSAISWWVNGIPETGDPARHKLYNDEVVVIAFAPAGTQYPGDPPSAARLPDRVNGATTPTTPATAPASASGTPCRASLAKPGTDLYVPVEVGPPPTTLVVKDVKRGTGTLVRSHATVTVDYVGVVCSTGKVFDSSFQHGGPASFPLDGVIAGWQQGLAGMRVGGRRLLGVPPGLAYGSQGQPAAGIAPGETLWFLVTVRATH